MDVQYALEVMTVVLYYGNCTMDALVLLTKQSDLKFFPVLTYILEYFTDLKSQIGK